MRRLIGAVRSLAGAVYPDLRQALSSGPVLRQLAQQLSLDIRMGRCSGFRPCCIAFYTVLWMPSWVLRPCSNELRGVRLKYWKFIRIEERGYGYVPCPLCYALKSFVRVRQCDRSCGHRDESRRLYWED